MLLAFLVTIDTDGFVLSIEVDEGREGGGRSAPIHFHSSFM